MTPYITLPPIPAWILPLTFSVVVLVACHMDWLATRMLHTSSWRRAEKTKIILVAVVAISLTWFVYAGVVALWWNSGGAWR